jgi:MFS family permease
VFSALTRYFGLRPLLFTSGILAGIAVAIYGQSPPDIQILSLLSACAGFMTNAVVVGSYALMAEIFPVNLRAGGTGFIIGVGRGGAAMGPIIAGFLFTAGWSLAGVATAMAAGSIIAAIAFIAVRPVVEQEEQAASA